MSILSVALLSEGSVVDLDATFFVQLAIFLAAFVMLRWLVIRPVMTVIESREDTIEGAKVEAREIERELKSAGGAFEEKLHVARVAASVERDRLRSEGRQMERKLLEQVRTETNKQIAEADATLKVEELRLRRDLQARTQDLGKQIASRLLERDVA